LEETQYVDLRRIPLPRYLSGRIRSLNIPLDKIYIHVQALEEKQARAERQAEEAQVKRGLKWRQDERRGRRESLAYLRELGSISSARPRPIKRQSGPTPLIHRPP
jgi:hypothetical protein